MQPNYAQEIAAGQRFEFGKNWARFLKHINAERIELAKASLQSMLQAESLAGRTFLDIGCGSGLSSLAARQLGARVHSFDYDYQSVACAKELRERFFRNDPDWTIETGSVLDEAYLASLNRYDVVYSWGVLHHTGAMWRALGNVASLVNPGGLLFIALYNDQGWISDYWKFMKERYNRGRVQQSLVIALHFPYLMMLVPLIQLAKGTFHLKRGMSRWHDFLDWLGGLPIEVALPDVVSAFFRQRGFSQERLHACGRRHGCNEYVFRKT